MKWRIKCFKKIFNVDSEIYELKFKRVDVVILNVKGKLWVCMGGFEEEVVWWDLIYEEFNVLCGFIVGLWYCKECEVKERCVVDWKKVLKKLMFVMEMEYF